MAIFNSYVKLPEGTFSPKMIWVLKKLSAAVLILSPPCPWHSTASPDMEPTPSTSFPGSWSLSLGMADRRVPIDSSWWLLVVYDEFMVVYWSSLMTWPSSSTPSFHTSKPRSYRIQFHLVIPFHRNHRNPIKRKELEIQTTHGTHGFSYWKIILKSIVFHSCPLFLIADFADLKSQRLSPTFGTPGDHFKASSPENNSSGVPGNTSRADHTSERTIMTTGGFIDRTTTSIGIAPKKYQMEKKHTPLSTFYRRYEFRGIWVKYCKIMTFGSIYMEEHVEDPNLGGGLSSIALFFAGPRWDADPAFSGSMWVGGW